MISMDEERSQVTKMLDELTEVLTVTRAQAKKKPQQNAQERMSFKDSWEEQRQVRDKAQSTRDHREATKIKKKKCCTLIQGLRCPESQVKDLSTLIQGLRCPESQVKDLSTLIQGLRCPESQVKDLSTLIQGLRCPESQVKDLSTLIQGLRCPESQVKDLSTLIQGLRCPESQVKDLSTLIQGLRCPESQVKDLSTLIQGLTEIILRRSHQRLDAYTLRKPGSHMSLGMADLAKDQSRTCNLKGEKDH